MHVCMCVWCQRKEERERVRERERGGSLQALRRETDTLPHPEQLQGGTGVEKIQH